MWSVTFNQVSHYISLSDFQMLGIQGALHLQHLSSNTRPYECFKTYDVHDGEALVISPKSKATWSVLFRSSFGFDHDAYIVQKVSLLFQ